MSSPVLIAYATRGGSTGEVAQAIGVAFREAGVEADVLPVAQVTSLTGRSALILGAPLYVGSFPKEYHQFLRRHREELRALPAWCFVLGPTRNEPKDFEGARKQAMRQLARYPCLPMVDLHIFGGKWDVKSLPFPFSLVRRLPGNPLEKIPASDIRDWVEIREWSVSIARQIKPAA